ncbi:GFA family protein [Oceanicella sp. SM1341]|uniref:GFA family protein n=1 Tax=Oceanicella sp. SM1341 TaxID=1548889 RepID=UPI000E4F1C36|nr:GFA family protein [Oceanicella sp. SM1341]
MNDPSCSGGCPCGGVRFEGRLESTAVVACHCGQCRASSGHFWASAALSEARISGEALRWHRSSPGFERGFCGGCGAFLFWRPEGATRLAVSAAAVHSGPALRLERHIYTADKGSYYEITDPLPCFEQDDAAPGARPWYPAQPR